MTTTMRNSQHVTTTAASQTLAQLGVTIPYKATEATIMNVTGTINYAFGAAATAAGPALPSSPWVFPTDRASLATMQLIGTGGSFDIAFNSQA